MTRSGFVKRRILRDAVRRLVGDRIWYTLARGKAAAISAGATAVAASLRVSSRLSAATRDRLRILERLDYAESTIWLEIDGERELLTRVRACAKEPETVRWIQSHIDSGEIVYDIGANIGAYSLVVDAWSGGRSTVYSFEPSFSTFAQLCRNVLVNGCSGRVIPLNIALADRTRLGSLAFSSIQAGAALHELDAQGESRSSQFAHTLCVPVFALDDFVAIFALPPPHHMKIDVDGPEIDVLLGARQVLKASSLRTVLIEITEGDRRSDAVRQLLVDAGFTMADRYDHDGPATASNLLFIRAEGSSSGRFRSLRGAEV